jgi:hypothetical protein
MSIAAGKVNTDAMIVGNTHEERTLSYLKIYGSITSLEAIRDLGNTRLAASICKLRKKGYAIASTPTTVPTRWYKKDGSQKTTSVSKYILTELKLPF